MASLLEQLAELPDSWGFVAVNGNKEAYQRGWQRHPLTKEAVAEEIRLGRARAVGVLAGPPSGGLLFLDHDGLSATTQLEQLGVPPRDIPRSITVTSGRSGRFQVLLSIPERFWPDLANRRVWCTGVIGDDGKEEQLELRWSLHYSVVIGDHPITSGYRWIRGRSPAELPLAEAPEPLIQLLRRQPPQPSQPLLLPLTTNPTTTTADGLPLLEFITRDSRQLIESGGTPGCWNDDQLRLSLDLIGTEAWIRSQGHSPDITAQQAFSQHIANARRLQSDFCERKAWARFSGAEGRSPLPGTPLDKLLSRLAFHTRTSRPVLPLAPQEPPHQQRAVKESLTAAQPASSATAPPPDQVPPYAPSFAKPQKLESAELLAMLRSQAQGATGRIRWNTYSQSLEINGEPLDGAERFYLLLSEQGYKVTKDLALDCLIHVARMNPYDPVTEYLDHVAATVQPAYIDGLATAYLRPEDAHAGEPTLYDHMLRCTLIGAVRRAFEPGCKHDTACVLMGEQGARKSSFWAALGGPFFSDSLGDVSAKDDRMILHRSWIMEWAELDHIVGLRHAGQVKAFLSQATDLFRVPYGKTVEAFPRRGIIVGTTNRSTGFLVDDTGNRRFWVIPLASTEANPIDTATLMAERDAIWSAAVHAYRDGASNYLLPELAQQVMQENETYQVESPWKAAIVAWINQPKNAGVELTSELLLAEAIDKPTERQTRTDQMQVASIMRELGYNKVRRMAQGQQRWVFCKQ